MESRAYTPHKDYGAPPRERQRAVELAKLYGVPLASQMTRWSQTAIRSWMKWNLEEKK